jgi:catabolite regulation protein CreA
MTSHRPLPRLVSSMTFLLVVLLGRHAFLPVSCFSVNNDYCASLASSSPTSRLALRMGDDDAKRGRNNRNNNNGNNGASPFAAAHAMSAAKRTVNFRNGDGDSISNVMDPSRAPGVVVGGAKVRTWLVSAAMILAGTTGAFLAAPPPLAASAAESPTVVGSLKGSGLVFKDTLQIERFEDPKIRGVVLYISNFDKPLTEKIGKGNFFNDPSYASVACARSGGGPVSVADNIGKGPQGEEVFEEARSLLFKTLRVQRIYDEDKRTAVYVSYNTRLDKNDDSNKSRFKSSLCAVNLD